MIAPRVRLSAYYLTLMTVSAVATPLLAIYLDGKGLSPSQIAQVNALPLGVMLFCNLFIGRLADRVQRWKATIVIGTGLGLVAPLFLPWAETPLALMALWIFVLAPVNLMVPISDAATVRHVRTNGGSFSRIRLWATVGHMIVTAIASLSFDAFGIGVFVPLLAGLAALRLAAASALPDFPKVAIKDTALAPLAEPAARPSHVAMRFVDLFRPWFLLPCLAAAVLNASHFGLNAFGALFWVEDGISGTWIGVFWLIAGASEVLTMAVFPQVSRFFSARGFLILAGACVILRWTVLSLSPPVAIIVLTQLLHGITFGLSYLAAVSFIARWSDDRLAAQAQSFLSTIRQAAAFFALLLFGLGAEHFGTHIYLGAAACGLVGIGFCALSLLLMPAGRLGPAE